MVNVNKDPDDVRIIDESTWEDFSVTFFMNQQVKYTLNFYCGSFLEYVYVIILTTDDQKDCIKGNLNERWSRTV